MRLLVLAILALSSFLCAQCQSFTDEWGLWKQVHGKTYLDAEEEGARKMVWTENYRLIREHNSKNLSFTLDLNEFADMTQEEFHYFYLPTSVNLTEWPTGDATHQPLQGVQYDSSLDWRDEGYVTRVKNQGQCGSCWAFSATGALEGQHYRKNGQLVSLSEQQLVDCSWKYGNAGCNGGLMDYAFKYVKNNGGICSGDDYPYLGYMWRCASKYCTSVSSCSGYVDISSGSESALLDAVATIGPVSVAIDASSYSFQFYSSGVFYDSSCSSSQLNHGVLVVGYGAQNGKNYWIIKNSWGSSWGYNGYIKMSRGKNNNCGIASAASYPKV